MKKTYKAPELEITCIETEQILNLSAGANTSTYTDGFTADSKEFDFDEEDAEW